MLIALLSVLTVLTALGVCGAAGAFASSMWLWLLPVCLLGGFLLYAALAFGFLLLACAVVDPQKPQEEDSRFYRNLVNWYIEAILTLARIRIHTRGLEKTPQSGRFLLVCNHIHDTDPAMIMRCFPKSQLAFVAKREVREMFLVGKLLPKLLCSFINRENDREALKTILRCISLLKEDKVSIGIFPEGYICPERKLQHFRPGVFKIAQKAKVPIVVCTLRDTQYVVKNLLKLKPSQVELHLLDVIPPEELEGVTTVEIADRVYRMMAQDLGPERVLEENT
ncbi:MAG: 1-acyl-sn-glycerol-3-phosphate acyltransferase [Oscillospiraceae bacterium]|nr:1-acyl-sn-glycerol-3-phosphate acyltransferase [Oscillospiraceae bacterium]